jgi:hypothetical protein
MFNILGHNGNANQNDWDFITLPSELLSIIIQTIANAREDAMEGNPNYTLGVNVN